MDLIAVVAVGSTVLATVAAAWGRAGRRARPPEQVVQAPVDRRTRSDGPPQDLPDPAGPQPGDRTDLGFDPDELPLSRDFLPEDGDPPPVERDLFAELARRRVRDAGV